jgi:hypothetical protein
VLMDIAALSYQEELWSDIESGMGRKVRAKDLN